MRLEPTYKPLVGVNAASLASVPVLVLLFVLSYRPISPPVGPSARHDVVSAPQMVTSAAVQQPVVKPPEVAHAVPERRLPPAVAAGKSAPGKVVYSVRWSGGGIRRKVAGNVPSYPAGVTAEALVRLEVVVAGGGSVRSARVLQAGDAQCDEEALREVRQWKFEPLPRQQARDQKCVVLVSFMRK